MKRLSRIVGVTLLEIMLVLAVAALVVVMSIKYYQSTQTAVVAQTLQRAVTIMMAGAESTGLAAGSYINVTPESLVATLPSDMRDAGKLTSIIIPGYADAVVGATGGATSYNATLTFTTQPASFCAQAGAIANSIAKQHGGEGKCSGKVASWTVNLNPK